MAVAALAVGGTIAFFSDTETSTGNTFTAGAIDLKVDSECSYNGEASDQCGTWALKDLDPTLDKFFNFADIKPGDEGENTISLHVINNDAWVCAEVSNLTNLENGQTEPEASVDPTTGVNDGELQNAMVWTVWRDDGEGGGVIGDNVQNGDEETLATGQPVNGVLAVYDSTTGTPLAGGSTAYIGVAWSLPLATGNEVQTDSLTGDISFEVVQSRNNEQFVCGDVQVEDPEVTEGDGWSPVDLSQDGKDWFAKAKVQEPNPASDFEVQVGVGDSVPADFDQGDTVYPNGSPVAFTLVYDAGTDTATFTANGEVTTYLVGNDDITNIGITVRAPSGATTLVDNLSLSTGSLSDDDVTVSDGTAYLMVSGATLNAGFTLTGDLTFTWVALTSNGENQKMQISLN